MLYGVNAPSADVLQQNLNASLDIIEYRGPDSRGTYVSPDGRAGLGHVRLSIIDLATELVVQLYKRDGFNLFPHLRGVKKLPAGYFALLREKDPNAKLTAFNLAFVESEATDESPLAELSTFLFIRSRKPCSAEQS
ncbi:Asparagine synthase [Mycena sanguinolenta]|uniref:Asparagine synthase n=1 Tax=Mycena sanguinolenta TaxID=230812 RepID=A0A8H6U1H5_9AGAR|nr:Asparagine synthase [Mycena sanguinolenta]